MEGFDFEIATVVYDKFYGYGELGSGFNRGYDIILNRNSVYTFEFWDFDPRADENRFTIDDSIPQKYFDNMYDAAEYARGILNKELEEFISKELYIFTHRNAA